MVNRHVRIYIEGGSIGKSADNDFRRGWKKFLTELHDLARENGFQSLEIVRGTSRSETYDQFVNYKAKHKNDLCVLLVDSECNVEDHETVWKVVKNRAADNWNQPPWATDEHLYLMVPFVEAWLVADLNSLKVYFKRDFEEKYLIFDNIESRTKDFIEDRLRKATKKTKRKEYKHGYAHEIIENASPSKIKTLKHGNRLFDCLGRLIVASRV